MLFAGAGGALGLLLAYGTLTSASTLLAGQVPRAEEISIDGRVLLFAIGVSMLTGMLAGTLPAVRASRSDLNDTLKEGGRSDSAIGVGTRRLLVVCEVALSLVLLMGAGVMIQSLLALRHGNTGFDPNNVLTMDVRLVDARYPRRHGGRHSLTRRCSAFEHCPASRLRERSTTCPSEMDPHRLSRSRDTRLSATRWQCRSGRSPRLLACHGDPVLRGRDIVESDAEVLLVSAEAAKLYWGADDPMDAAPFYRPCRRRCFVRWLESSVTSSSGISLKPRRPR